ncbi:DUF3334 family protein [Uliginosibacterium aquaticum]|uniref:DUF3334 family protein n=1 Tax=Uliginosibacterium aquaticum TaxID=2731212 RepID=A0ABX2IDN4_9RHOO|nr:DUF3334 family protein [Uliginosibacterium aquaticum]NSL54674.1 DUF3334 family protein [Uliginosibacterium aquaticum]
MTEKKALAVFGTEDVLIRLCNAVSGVLKAASHSQIRYSGMVQRITKTCLKPDIGCFVLFDGGFSGLVVLNFSAPAAMELYEQYMLNMGMSKADLATAHTSDDVSNVMGELMNQIVGEFVATMANELQTHITQSQPKMLVINKQVMLSVDTNIDTPEARRVTFHTGRNNIFYLEMAIDRTEFIQLYDFEPQAAQDPDELLSRTQSDAQTEVETRPSGEGRHDKLLDDLGM